VHLSPKAEDTTHPGQGASYQRGEGVIWLWTLYPVAGLACLWFLQGLTGYRAAGWKETVATILLFMALGPLITGFYGLLFVLFWFADKVLPD